MPAARAFLADRPRGTSRLLLRAGRAFRRSEGAAAHRRASRPAFTAPTRPAGRSPAITPGLLLYRTLHRFGFASRPESKSRDDGLKLIELPHHNSVKCVPPGNKPLPAEIRTCNRLPRRPSSPALASAACCSRWASIAHNAVLRALALKPSEYEFAHAAEHALPGGRILLDSYHCSRYNTQTRRLTPKMFADVFARARQLRLTRALNYAHP